MTAHNGKGRIPMLERDQVQEEIGVLYDKLLAERGIVPDRKSVV